ncbi:MAG: efflux RND transporter periplasmic adaptor subunit [Pseudomonadales bacterium]|nr:efflux RND transporter periplasmic adaptor subunit [Pseudomonadales bacterium]
MGDTDQSDSVRDKRALLSELKIDRSTSTSDRGRPLKWFIAVALAGGLVFVGLFVDFSPRAIPVSTAPAQAAAQASSGDSVLDATGYVVARRQATVSAKTTGKVIRVLIEEGDRVTRDQLLAVLDDTIPRAQFELSESQYRAASAGLAELRVQLKQAELDLQRTAELAGRQLASQADLDRDGLNVEALTARLARASAEVVVAERSLDVQRRLLDDMEIRAPFAGIVVAKAAQPGEMISPVSAGGGFTRTGICTIVDMDSLEVEVDVNESYINRVYPEQPVQVTLNAYPQDGYQARVIAIIPTADRSKATVRVRVGLEERDDRVLPDMGVRVAFLEVTETAAEPGQEGVLVPSSAVVSDAGGSYVFVVRGDRAERRGIETGGEAGSKMRIINGLVTGERVVLAVSAELQARLEAGEAITLLN